MNPALRDPALGRRWLALLAGLVLLWPLLVLSEFKPWTLLEERGLRATGRYLAQFVHMRVDTEFLAMLAADTWRTVAIATAGLSSPCCWPCRCRCWPRRGCHPARWKGALGRCAGCGARCGRCWWRCAPFLS